MIAKALSAMRSRGSQRITRAFRWRLRVASVIAVMTLVPAGPLVAQLRQPDHLWQFEELLVVGDEIFIGASPEWFPKGQGLRVYSQLTGIDKFLIVGEQEDRRFISADKSGRLFITSTPDRFAARWTYYGPVHVADEGLTAIVHEELTDLWRNPKDPEEIKVVWPAFLRPAEEPTVIRDKDGVERKVFRAVLRKQPAHQKYFFTVSRVRKEEFYPDPYLLGTGQYSVGGLCVYRGEVYYGKVTENQFDAKDWTDYWLPDAPFLVTKWEKKFRLLSVTEEGEIKLADRATLNTYWRFSVPQKKSRQTPIGFEMHNFKSMRDSQEVRYLVPDDKPMIVKDLNGKEVELFRLKLGKERHYYHISRYAP